MMIDPVHHVRGTGVHRDRAARPARHCETTETGFTSIVAVGPPIARRTPCGLIASAIVFRYDLASPFLPRATKWDNGKARLSCLKGRKTTKGALSSVSPADRNLRATMRLAFALSVLATKNNTYVGTKLRSNAKRNQAGDLRLDRRDG